MSIHEDWLLNQDDQAGDLAEQTSTPPLPSRVGLGPPDIEAHPCLPDSKHRTMEDGGGAVEASEGIKVPDDTNDASSKDIFSRHQHLLEQCPKMAKEFAVDYVVVQAAQGVPVAELAERFQRTERTIYNWKKEGLERFSNTCRQHHCKQIAQMVGQDIRLFEVRMRLGYAMATDPNASPKENAQGLKIAEVAHQGLIDFRSKLGFYAHKPLARAVIDETDSHVSDAELIADCAQEIMNAVFVALRNCDGRGEADVA